MDTVSERLREAAREGHAVELQKLLGDPTCDPLNKDQWGMTALMLAACTGREACVRLLLSVSDALAKSNYGKTALMWAAYSGSASCARLLLPVSDPAVRDHDGKTASKLATDRGLPELASLLDAYSLAMSEMTTLRSSTDLGLHRQVSSPRL